MAAIVNDRDLLLQATNPRFIPPEIDPSLIPGYEDALEDIEDLQDEVDQLGLAIDNVMNTSSSFFIRASGLVFTRLSGTTTPSTITLTAERGSGLVGGVVTWSVVAGSATLSASSGNSTVVTGSTVAGRSVTIRARLIVDGKIHDAYVVLTRLGQVAAGDVINLSNQVTGSLASGNVSGLGALALLNTVDLNTQTTGALNGLTQVTNLGSLAYANAIAANQIGAGTLAAGVVYAGSINANQVQAGSFEGKTFTGGTFTGGTFQTSATGHRIEILGVSNRLTFFSSGSRKVEMTTLSSGGQPFEIKGSGGIGATRITNNPGRALEVIGAGGEAAVFQTSVGETPVVINPSASLPTTRHYGGLCFYNGWLCFSDGNHWYRSDGQQLT